MKKFLLLFLLAFSFSSVNAVTKTEDREVFKLLVTDVEFGKPFNISAADLAGQIADLENDERGSENLVLRFRFKAEEEQKVINIIDGGFIVANRPEIHIIKTQDNSSYISDTDYALVTEANFNVTGALTRTDPRSQANNNNETTFVYRTQDLRSRNNRIPIFEMQISSATSFRSNNFDMVFNFYSPDETIASNLDGSPIDNNDDNDDDDDDQTPQPPTVEELTSFIRAAMFDAADSEVTPFRNLDSTVLKCEALDDVETDIDVCSAEGIQELATDLKSARDSLETSRNALKDTIAHVRTAQKNKYISKIEANSIIRKLKCARKQDRQALKFINKLDKSLDAFTEAGQGFEPGSRNVKSVVKIVAAIEGRIQRAYEKCKRRAVDLLFKAQLADAETLEEFPESINDYELLDE